MGTLHQRSETGVVKFEFIQSLPQRTGFGFRHGMQGFQDWYLGFKTELSAHVLKIVRTDGQRTVHIKNPVAPLAQPCRVIHRGIDILGKGNFRCSIWPPQFTIGSFNGNPGRR